MPHIIFYWNFQFWRSLAFLIMNCLQLCLKPQVILGWEVCLTSTITWVQKIQIATNRKGFRLLTQIPFQVCDRIAWYHGTWLVKWQMDEVGKANKGRGGASLVRGGKGQGKRVESGGGGGISFIKFLSHLFECCPQSIRLCDTKPNSTQYFGKSVMDCFGLDKMNSVKLLVIYLPLGCYYYSINKLILYV